MRRKIPFLIFFIFLFAYCAFSQTTPKSLPAKRTFSNIKIDGKPDEAAWKEAIPATQFVEWRPNFGAIEDTNSRTEVWIVYDNASIYIGGYCYEKSKDSVSRELIGRDQIGVNDYLGVIFDTYNDKINGFGFYVTPLGEQFDAKYSNTAGEDESWNGVWDSESQLLDNGWSFEMRIPYSAIRFVSKENQTWGLNITRNRKKAGRQFMWSPVNPKVNGFVNQEGQWTGIEKIKTPVRLSFSPYLSTYVNHYPNKASDVKDWTASVNGGMDVKYGISDAFTLDMTLIPDFGQVQSDNRVLNLSPFEVRYNENRPFFTEGTELFSKGNLFYSRRIGSQPIHYYDIQDTASSYPGHITSEEEILKNPSESKLINATKISGRTKKGFGLGIFNAITKPMYAEVRNKITGETREVQTNPLTNYNIIVFDQTLKNNSSVSFINTSTIRNGSDKDANVSAALFNLNNKKNSYNIHGKVGVSQLLYTDKNVSGYTHNLGIGKTGGNWNFQISQELVDDKYNINDMGLMNNNNFFDHHLWTAYRWLKPGKWYNRIQLNYNAHHSSLYKKITGQKISSGFQSFSTNVNANVQFKNLWWVGMYIGYGSQGNNFYEPRTPGYSFRSPRRTQFNVWFETNATKKYYAGMDYFLGIRSLFNSPNHQVSLWHRYRFSDKFSISHNLYYNPARDDAGYYGRHYKQDGNGDYVLDANGNTILENILFSRRDLRTVENIITFKYSFSNKSWITLRARHYWSRVKVKQLYDLQHRGTLTPTSLTNPDHNHQNYNIFNIDAVYTWQFAPGSFLNVVWKEEGSTFDQQIDYQYFKNFGQTISAPQNNNLSIKIIYFLDYLDFKKWKRNKTKG